MPLSMHQACVPAFNAGLSACAKLLGKAAAEAAARGLDEAALLNARLAPDMFCLTQQVQTLTDIAKGAVARLAGLPVPQYVDDETSFAGLAARLDRTLAFVSSVGASAVDGSEAREVVLLIGGNTLRFTGQDYLLGFAVPNFYFHLATTYGILRHNGFQIGKRDYFGRA